MLLDQTCALEQTQVTRNCWPADGQVVRDLVDGQVVLAQQPKDLAAVGVAERLEGIGTLLLHQAPSVTLGLR
jgi:hypothetical protein